MKNDAKKDAKCKYKKKPEVLLITLVKMDFRTKGITRGKRNFPLL